MNLLFDQFDIDVDWPTALGQVELSGEYSIKLPNTYPRVIIQVKTILAACFPPRILGGITTTATTFNRLGF